MTLKLSAWVLVGVAVFAVLLGSPDVSTAASDTYKAGVERLIAEARKTPERARLNRLFELSWDYLMEEYPEWATEVGISAYNGRWTDRSAAAITRRKADLELPAKALASIDRAKLAPEDALNYDLFKRRIDVELDGRRFPWELLPLSQLYGIQQSVAQILSEQMPTRSAADYEAILSRLRATPTLVDQTIAGMREGLRRGITPP